MMYDVPTGTKRRFAQLILLCMASLWPQLDAMAQDNDAEGSQNQNIPNTIVSTDPDKLSAYKGYKAAAERYSREIKTYKIDLRKTLMSDYQNRLSSIDSTYQKKLSTLRSEEKELRDKVIERMETFLRRYGEKHEKSADILYRLARLYYEREDIDNNYPITLSYIEKLQTNFPAYSQMDGALYLKGYCLNQMGRSNEARDTFLQMITAYPNSSKHAEVLMRLGEYYFNKSQDAILGNVSEDGKSEIMWNEALKYYTDAVNVGSDTSIYDKALYRKAWTEYYTEDYDEMIHDFITLVEFANTDEKHKDLRTEAIDFMAAALAEEDWDLSDDISIDPDFGIKRFDKYLNKGMPYENEVLRKFADTLMQQMRYDKAIEAYAAYIDRDKCAKDLPEVIRIYVAALNYDGKFEEAAAVQGSIKQRIGTDSEWYACQEREGNLEAIANADLAMEQALKNSIMAFNNKANIASGALNIALDDLNNPDLSEAERAKAEYTVEQKREELRQANLKLAEITEAFVNIYPNDEENYTYRYLLGQALFDTGQYKKAIDILMTIRDIDNSHFQADTARYIADSYEYLIIEKAKADTAYINALPMAYLLRMMNEGKIKLTDAPTSILLTSGITIVSQEEIDRELEARKGGSIRLSMPDNVQKLIDSREIFSQFELKSGKNDTDPTSHGPQYRFENAIIYYNYGNFEEAEKRFTEIIENSPASEYAVSAANIIITEYEMQDNLDKVAELSELYAGMQLGSADSDSVVNSRFNDKKYNALFKKAFKLFDNKKYLEAAEEFIHIIEENPAFERNYLALYNAAYAYEQMKHYDSAMKLYRRVITEYGDTKEAVSALYKIGVNAEMFFDFDTAVDSFLSLYNNREPFYREFKNRINALRNAARIKLLVEDKKGAAKLFKRYHDDYPGQPDAPHLLYEAGRLYFELGSAAEGKKIFREYRQKYASAPAMLPYTIASHVIEANYIRDHQKRQINTAKEHYETARTLYQNAPDAAGAVGRDSAAEASFALATLKYEKWKDTKIKGRMKNVTIQLQNYMKEMKQLYAEFSQVMSYNNQLWIIASGYAIGKLMHEAFDKLEHIPCPTDIREGSDSHLSFVSFLNDTSAEIRTQAVDMYQKTIDASKTAGISTVWTVRSLDGIKQLDRTASSQERIMPMATIYSSGALITPSEFKKQEAEKSEAEARAKAELEAAMKGDDVP